MEREKKSLLTVQEIGSPIEHQEEMYAVLAQFVAGLLSGPAADWDAEDVLDHAIAVTNEYWMRKIECV